MSDLSASNDFDDDNPFRTGRTSRGTIRALIAVEVAVDDETQLVAGSRFLEGIDDEIGQTFVTVEAALADSIAGNTVQHWPATSRLMGTVNVMVGGTSSGRTIDPSS